MATQVSRSRNFKLSREQWKLALAKALVENPLDDREDPSRVRGRSVIDDHSYIYYANGINARCKVCKKG